MAQKTPGWTTNKSIEHRYMWNGIHMHHIMLFVCLREVAVRPKHEFPIEAKAVIQDFYMDYVLTGAATRQGAKELQKQLSQFLILGHLPLREWRSNDNLMVGKSSQNLWGSILWNSSQDTLQYQVKLCERLDSTKKTILSKISQIFDPLELVSSVSIKRKIFMQKLWTKDLDWD